MTTESTIDRNTKELRKKLLEISTWAMLLSLALVLEAASTDFVLITGTHRHVQSEVAGAVLLMAVVFGILLATTVGILILHVRYDAPYRYWYVVLDIVFVTVPLYVAVKFVAVSIVSGQASGAQLGFNEGLFRTGSALIAVSYFFVVVRDFIVLPEIRDQLTFNPLRPVASIHALGALLFLSVAIVPRFVVPFAIIGSIGIGLFFAGMAAIPFIDKRFAVVKPTPELGN
jgi:hypothetical protein